MYTQVTQEQIMLWRAKAREGTLTREEMRQAIDILRADRKKSGETSAKARTKKAATAAKKNIDSEDLLKELDGL